MNVPRTRKRGKHLLAPIFALLMTIVDFLIILLLFYTLLYNKCGTDKDNDGESVNSPKPLGPVSKLNNNCSFFIKKEIRTIPRNANGSEPTDADIDTLTNETDIITRRYYVEVVIFYWYFGTILVNILGAVIGLVLSHAIKVSTPALVIYVHSYIFIDLMFQIQSATGTRYTYPYSNFRTFFPFVALVSFVIAVFFVDYYLDLVDRKTKNISGHRHKYKHHKLAYTFKPPKVLVEPSNV